MTTNRSKYRSLYAGLLSNTLSTCTWLCCIVISKSVILVIFSSVFILIHILSFRNSYLEFRKLKRTEKEDMIFEIMDS